MLKTRRKKKWYKPTKHTGWRKEDTQTKRRRAMLSAHKGDYLASARAMQSLANVTTDPETRRKAKADAKYFYREYRKRSKKSR